MFWENPVQKARAAQVRCCGLTCTAATATTAVPTSAVTCQGGENCRCRGLRGPHGAWFWCFFICFLPRTMVIERHMVLGLKQKEWCYIWSFDVIRVSFVTSS